MKTMKNAIFNLILTVLTLFLGSCENSTVDSKEYSAVKFNEDIDATPVSIEKKEKTIDFSNPAFFGGSDFGSYIRVLYTQGKFDEIVNVTSKETIDKFGKENLIKFYKNMSFGYELKLNSQSFNKQDSTIVLNYMTNIIATKRVIRMKTKVENDTVRLVIDNIKTKNPFDAH